VDAVVAPGLRDCAVRDLGRQPYEPVWRAMQRFTDQRDSDTSDELWLVEHDPVFTLGQAGKPEHVLAAGDIPVLHVDRGGQVTYHGPGQLVAYPIIGLSRRGLLVRPLVRALEGALIDTCRALGVEADRLQSQTLSQPSFRRTLQAAFCKCRRPSNSAICTAFSAAPLRRLSDTHHSARPLSTVGSSRTREMNVA